jgi:hypothetical protein
MCFYILGKSGALDSGIESGRSSAVAYLLFTGFSLSGYAI